MYTILASFIKANSVELPAIIKSALFFLQIVKTEIVFQFDFSCLLFTIIWDSWDWHFFPSRLKVDSSKWAMQWEEEILLLQYHEASSLLKKEDYQASKNEIIVWS